jgi:hypothetical protein
LSSSAPGERVKPIQEAEEEQLGAERRRQQLEWRWLRRSLWGGSLLGAFILGVCALATWTPSDNSGALFAMSRGDYALLGVLFGLIIGPIAGFVLWMLWVNSRSLVRLSRSLVRHRSR